ncbi:MAG TPA: DNA-binding domain-containing protein [Marinospirillum sp.]|nr:DNA-binding domain-containing protein [Marinospirillum sp.]HKM16205.1 DNA-binding domain-containing protein [Marinospirillum sp.]
MHKSFYNALLNTDSVLPKGLVSWNKTNCERRFAVYRNNVVVSLIDALAVNFPVVQHLVGEVFFGLWLGSLSASFHPKHLLWLSMVKTLLTLLWLFLRRLPLPI